MRLFFFCFFQRGITNIVIHVRGKGLACTMYMQVIISALKIPVLLCTNPELHVRVHLFPSKICVNLFSNILNPWYRYQRIRQYTVHVAQICTRLMLKNLTVKFWQNWMRPLNKETYSSWFLLIIWTVCENRNLAIIFSCWTILLQLVYFHF